MNLFTRYLLRAHIGPFFFAFVALTGVILINTLAKELANLAGKGLPGLLVAEFFVLSLPANIALTMPMAVLVAVLYTFSNLAAENEITALRASGVDLRRVVLPLLVAAGLLAVGMVGFNDRVLPAANYRWRMLMTDVAQTRSLLALEPQTINQILGSAGTSALFLEAEEIDAESGSMRRVRIYEIGSPQSTRTITADSGHVALDSERTDLLLTLYDGTVEEVDFQNPTEFQIFTFAQQVMRMADVSGKLERTRDAGSRSDRDMTVGMMQARIDTIQGRLARQWERIDSIRAATVGDIQGTAPGEAPRSDSAAWSSSLADTTLPGYVESADTLVSRRPERLGSIASVEAGESLYVAAPPVVVGSDSLSEPSISTSIIRDTSEVERYERDRARLMEKDIRELRVEMHKKFAIASAAFIFVLMGAPIALRFPRGGIGMVIAISLSVFGVYYVGLIGGETLGDGGYVPPALAMWGTNIIFGILGLIGYWRLGREQGTSRGSGWGELPAWVRLPRLRRSGR